MADIPKHILDAAATIVRSGIMPLSNSGNISVRVPGSNTFLITSHSSLANVGPEDISLFDLRGRF